MKRILLLAFAFLALAVLACADEVPAPAPAEQAERFHRNRELVQTLVENGLLLASEESPLRRAEHCNTMGRLLADEISLAARGQEGYRALELGGHLQLLLHEGVAGLLKDASGQIDVSSPGQKELKRIRQNVRNLTQPVEDQLKLRDDEQLREALKAVEAGRLEVEKALNSLGKKPAVLSPR